MGRDALETWTFVDDQGTTQILTVMGKKEVLDYLENKRKKALDNSAKA